MESYGHVVTSDFVLYWVEVGTIGNDHEVCPLFSSIVSFIWSVRFHCLSSCVCWWLHCNPCSIRYTLNFQLPQKRTTSLPQCVQYSGVSLFFFREEDLVISNSHSPELLRMDPRRGRALQVGGVLQVGGALQMGGASLEVATLN